jgi:hypothetical protein
VAEATYRAAIARWPAARITLRQGSQDREHRTQWQRACELLLAETDVEAFSRQVEVALFYDAKLVLT